jgi:DNA-binding helix-hairpin-helix protein with protein kinase domain
MATGDRYLTAAGSEVRLQRLLGKGGEGAVFAVDGGRVAKIYAASPTPDMVRRIEFLIGVGGDDLGKVSAWPQELLRDTNGRVAGFTMRQIVASKPMHLLYSVKSRRTEFPQAGVPFLVHSAINLARAVASVHKSGIVIGDVNFNNILVDQQSMVALIDVDGFQVTDRAGHVFHCKVGMPEFTAPEIQGKSLASVVRTMHHDTFGLAVLIFYLLAVGRHPFAGVALDGGDLPIDLAIARWKYAYGPGAARFGVRQQVHTPQIHQISAAMARGFERAFSRDFASNRPTALEWVSLLEDFCRNHRVCSANRHHVFDRGATSCPWCALDPHFSSPLFPSSNQRAGQAGDGAGTGAFNVEYAWKAIVSVAAPSTLTSAPYTPNAKKPTPSTRAQELIDARASRRQNMVIITVGMLLSLALVAWVGPVMWVIVGALAAVALWSFARNGGDTAAKSAFCSSASTTLASARATFEQLEREWNGLMKPSQFDDSHRALAEAKRQYDQLSARKQTRLTQLETDARAEALNRHLRSKSVHTATIPGVGEQRRYALMNHGISSAFDVSVQRVANIPGFGEVLTGHVLDWRRSVEASFRFDPARDIPAARRQAVDAEINTQRVALERQLAAGPAMLTSIADDIVRRRADISALLIAAYAALEQAKVEAAAC